MDEILAKAEIRLAKEARDRRIIAAGMCPKCGGDLEVMHAVMDVEPIFDYKCPKCREFYS